MVFNESVQPVAEILLDFVGLGRVLAVLEVFEPPDEFGFVGKNSCHVVVHF